MVDLGFNLTTYQSIVQHLKQRAIISLLLRHMSVTTSDKTGVETGHEPKQNSSADVNKTNT